MELETLFAEQKWNILRQISETKSSPLQLAEKLDTSLANISQQLRLLEMANLLKTERVQNRDKGKPRKVFSLSDNFGYIIAVTDGFADKRLMHLTQHHRAILRIWFMENTQLHEPAQKTYWNLVPFLADAETILVRDKAGVCQFAIVANTPQGKKRMSGLRAADGAEILVYSSQDASRLKAGGKEPFSQDSFVIYADSLKKEGTEVASKS
ncbi:MAG: winged helix-turn-helix domain-containing protein [archaeon]